MTPEIFNNKTKAKLMAYWCGRLHGQEVYASKRIILENIKQRSHTSYFFDCSTNHYLNIENDVFLNATTRIACSVTEKNKDEK